MFTYYIGLNDKDTKKQEIDTENALKTITREINKDFTFSICNGVYTHEDGSKVCEVTIKIKSIGSLSNEMLKLKKIFNQECILEVSNGFELEKFI